MTESELLAAAASAVAVAAAGADYRGVAYGDDGCLYFTDGSLPGDP